MIDPFGRMITVMRISVTDRCNYRCVYCMPESGVSYIPHESILRYEEIRDVVIAAVAAGITRFRLTGGEPLVRPGLTNLVTLIRDVSGVEEIALTTNGSLLAPMAIPLKQAGVDRANISLDTLNPARFRDITRGGDVRDVLRGIDAALEADMTPVKLNIVVFPGESDRDAREVEAFAAARGCFSRRIQKMDLQAGDFAVVEHSDRRNCRVCNRLRLTSNGWVRSCLMDDTMFSVRTLGAAEAIHRAIVSKPEYGKGTSIIGMNFIGG
ncbi:radical SAM protein [bacterium]|nr:radical SAM protein [candidate division CSSED10-310 bacterium]